jgi:hypothetical protein
MPTTGIPNSWARARMTMSSLHNVKLTATPRFPIRTVHEATHGTADRHARPRAATLRAGEVRRRPYRSGADEICSRATSPERRRGG